MLFITWRGCILFPFKMANSKFQLGSFENPVKFKDQDYCSLKDASLKSGSLFCDPTFPAEQKSIGMPEDPKPENAVEWLRPKVCLFYGRGISSSELQCTCAVWMSSVNVCQFCEWSSFSIKTDNVYAVYNWIKLGNTGNTQYECTV